MAENRICPVGSFGHTIVSGDTLYKLANTYNTTVNAILAINPGINPNNLQIGSTVCIPSGSNPTNCPVGSFPHTIVSGDTLYNLARTYNTTVEAILAINPGINPNNLQIGSTVCIPNGSTPTNCPVGSFPYIIHTGDTLYNLAIEFNTTVNAILALNPGLNPNNLVVGSVICIPGTGPTPRCPVGSFQYTIKAGDTLYNLAIEYNTTVNAILAINPGLNPNNLRVGQVICMPGTGPTPQCPVGSFSYTIKAGDTLYNLAMEYNTTVADILAINPGLNPNNLQIGQVICIPRSTPGQCPVGSFSYTVKPGDTLYSLARTYNTTVAAILAINPGLDPNNLRVGQVICIPNSDPVGCPGGTVYVVKETDNLAVILLKFDISIMDLMYANPEVDWKTLMPGDILCIMPHKDMGCACSKGEKKYTIQQSDIPQNGSTVVALAKKFNISVSALMKMNPNLTPSDFVLGQMICVPKR